MQPYIIFPFGITVYFLCIFLLIVLGARKGYIGAGIIIGLYLIGGLAFCLATKTLQDYYLTVLLSLLQGIVFLVSHYVNHKKLIEK